MANANLGGDERRGKWQRRPAPPLPQNGSLVSNVLTLQGLGTTSSLNLHTGASGIPTDPFVLSMDYDAPLLASQSTGFRDTAMLGWLNPVGSATGLPQWQSAVLGNFGGPGADADPAEFQGSFAQFIENYEFSRDPALLPAGTDPSNL